MNKRTAPCHMLSVESVPTCTIRSIKGVAIKVLKQRKGTMNTNCLLVCIIKPECYKLYHFNLISAPSVHPPPPFVSSGTCWMQQPLHNTTKTISLCGSRLEFPPLLSPEHQIIIRGFMSGACIKLIAHTGNRARRITYKNGFHLALVLLLENMY